MDRRSRQASLVGFDTFDPKANPNEDRQNIYAERDRRLENRELWLQDKESEQADDWEEGWEKEGRKQYPVFEKITSQDKLVLDMNYRESKEKYERMRKSAFLDVIDKVNHFKLSGSSRVRISEFMNRKNKEDKLVYPFGMERDPLVMKVLVQVLYDELDKSLRSSCSGPTPAVKAKSDQAALQKMADRVEQIRKEEKARYEDVIKDLQGEVHLHKRQLKRKNWLVSRLFSDKSMFSKYWEDFSLLFVDVFRLLQQSEEIKDPELLDRIAKANEFVLWAKDYNEDERRYVEDQDWTNIKEREKKSFMDDVELSKRKVWDSERARHIERVSANQISLNQRLSKTEKKESKSVESQNPYKNLHQRDRHDSRYDSPPKERKTAGLIQPSNFQEFASSFNNLTYDQLQDFCLALSDQLTQLKKDTAVLKEKYEIEIKDLEEKVKLANTLVESDRENYVQRMAELGLEKTELAVCLEKCKREIERNKIGLTEASIMAFDCYNVVMNISKNSTYIQPFGRFLNEANSVIVQNYMKSRSLISKVEYTHSRL